MAPSLFLNDRGTNRFRATAFLLEVPTAYRQKYIVLLNLNLKDFTATIWIVGLGWTDWLQKVQRVPKTAFKLHFIALCAYSSVRALNRSLLGNITSQEI